LCLSSKKSVKRMIEPGRLSRFFVERGGSRPVEEGPGNPGANDHV
jgi:hypothetical protein